tara:strand:- start:741 stop:971 length:231 start_codon:yes stop_codon:yes gene_type:complete
MEGVNIHVCVFKRFSSRNTNDKIDMEMLKKQMEQHAKQELNLDENAMKHILEQSSCDIFPVQVSADRTHIVTHHSS